MGNKTRFPLSTTMITLRYVPRLHFAMYWIYCSQVYYYYECSIYANTLIISLHPNCMNLFVLTNETVANNISTSTLYYIQLKWFCVPKSLSDSRTTTVMNVILAIFVYLFNKYFQKGNDYFQIHMTSIF